MLNNRSATLLILTPVLSFSLGLPAHGHQFAHSYKQLKSLGAQNADAALSTAEARLKKNSEDLKALWLKAEALQFTGKSIEAESTFGKLLQSALKQKTSKKDLASIYAELSFLQASNGRPEDALNSFNKAIELNPQSQEIHLLKAWKLWQTAKKEAFSEFDAHIAAAKDEDSYVNKAHFLFDYKRTEDAFKTLKEAEQEFPDSPFVNFERAFFYCLKSDPANAEKYADLAQKKLNFGGYIYADISRFYKQQLKIDKSIEALHKLVRYWPRAESFSVLAKRLQDRGKIDEAAKVFDKATVLYPKMEDFVDRKCKMYRNAGRWKEALVVAQYRIDHFPSTDTFRYLNRGYCYEALGEYKKAVADFDRAIGGKTYRREVVNRAKCNLALKNYQRVLDDAKLCLESNPGHITAMQLKVQAKVEMGRLEDALNDADALVRNGDDNPEFFKLRAQVLQKLGRTKEAAADLAKAAKSSALYELPAGKQ